MLFPALLVWLFFYTLWKDHGVLYAPSDYREEKNFMNRFVNQGVENTPVVTNDAPLIDEVSESQLEDTSGAERQDEASARMDKGAQPNREPEETEARNTHRMTEAEVNSDNRDIPEAPRSQNKGYLPHSDIEKSVKRTIKKYVLDTQSLTRHLVAREMADEVDGTYKVNVSPKNLPNAKFDVVVESDKHYGIAQIITGRAKYDDSFLALSGIKNFYSTLSESEKSRFFARVVLVMQPMERISEAERRKFVLCVHEMPFKIEIEERYLSLNERRLMEIN